MGQPAAKKDDEIHADDTHIVLVQVGTVVSQQTVTLRFRGVIDGELSSNVNIAGKPAATADSTATNTPEHRLPTNQSFLFRPSNTATIKRGSQTVRINGKPAARNGDLAETCHDLPGAPPEVVARGSVLIG